MSGLVGSRGVGGSEGVGWGSWWEWKYEDVGCRMEGEEEGRGKSTG